MLEKPALQKKQIILFASDYADNHLHKISLVNRTMSTFCTQKLATIGFVTMIRKGSNQCSIGIKQDNLVNVLKIQHGKET